MPCMTEPGPEPATESASPRRPATAAELRALGHPLRLRILRLCLDEERTNKEVADALGRDPGTVLHHVRLLADAGFLREGEPRRGKRGSREKPYRATRLSWELDLAPIDEGGEVSLALVDAFAAELREALAARGAAAVLQSARLGLRLAPDDLAELQQRLDALKEEFVAREDPDGAPVSLLIALHRRA
jgi:DNA-binding transcriptional ArsR family regulator